jgi:hypothetical protein
MARIQNYFRPTDVDSFGPEILEAVGNAYEMTIAALHAIGHADVPREVIARRIIEAAQEGEHDPVVLSAIALGAFYSDQT